MIATNSIDNIFVAIRSVGERTEQACYSAALGQLHDDTQIRIIRNKVFAEAHIESIRLAIESNREWSLFLDADVLLRDGSIEQMVTEAGNSPGPFFMLNFPILDLGFNGPTFAGVHLYTTKYLHLSSQFYETISSAQRPETKLCEEISKLGVHSAHSTTIMGLHGYEQYYEDIYRTTFVRAVKFKRFFPYFLKLYRDKYDFSQTYGNDVNVMLWGLLDGTIFSEQSNFAPLDKRLYQDNARRILTLLGLSEKSAFCLDQIQIDKIIDEFVPDPDYLCIKTRLWPTNYWATKTPKLPLKQRILSAYYNLGHGVKRAAIIMLHGKY